MRRPCSLRYRDACPGLRYWKPIQTGIEQDDDTATVARLVGSAERVLDAGVRLPRPLVAASRRQARRPHDRHRLASRPLPGARRDRWIVEGAGGVLVPLNEPTLMVDLMVRLGLPVLVVARAGLGTINHTLLTLEALRARALPSPAS